MRVDRRLLFLIGVIALLALFIDGFAYVYRAATNQPLTGRIRGIPTLNIGFLGFSQQIFVHKGLDLQGGTHLELEISKVRSGTPIAEARDIAVAIIEASRALNAQPIPAYRASSTYKNIPIHAAGT